MRSIILVTAACSVTAPALGASESPAGATVLYETDTTLIMRFTDATNTKMTVTFARDSAEGVWMVDASLADSPRIVFGNNDPRLLGRAARVALELDPEDALQTFDASLAEMSFEDIAIYELYDGEAAIALIDGGDVTRVMYVGDLVENVLNWPDPVTCQTMLLLCCGITGNYHIGSCVTLAHPDNCTTLMGSMACSCLWDACNIAWIGDACTAYTNNCNPDDLDEDVQVVRLYEYVLSVAQEIHDSL